MKKGISILLLFCFLFYHLGYHVYYISLQHSIENNWQQRVYDEDFATEELLLEIPLSIPYMGYQEEFQVTNTSFVKDNKQFRAIKQRYANDTLQVIYTLDTAKIKLENTINNWIAFLTSGELPSQSNGKLVFIKIYKDYTAPYFSFFLQFPLSINNTYLGCLFVHYSSIDHVLEGPPPKYA